MEQRIERWQRPSQTKIVATVGPACNRPEDLLDLIHAGVDVFRINTAHGTREEHDRRVREIRQVSRDAGQVVAILVDLAGPKIRLGELAGGEHRFISGDAVRFVRDSDGLDPSELTTTYEPLLEELEVGDRIVLADGIVTMNRRTRRSGIRRMPHRARGRHPQPPGRQSAGRQAQRPALGASDRDNAIWAAQAGVDFLGLSFVRRDDELRELKALIDCARCRHACVGQDRKTRSLGESRRDRPNCRRGDGRPRRPGRRNRHRDRAGRAETDHAACHQYRKPVIIATQMLDSMQRSRMPTRAEVTDVANAILDGADACMLSGETAIGQYPREAVEMMHRIALSAEQYARDEPQEPVPTEYMTGLREITEATTFAAGRLADHLDARILLVASASGHTAMVVAKHHHSVPVIGVSNSEQRGAECVSVGVSFPWRVPPVDHGDELLEHVVQKGRASGSLAAGDRLVMVFGTGIRSSRHNMIVVHQIE